MNMFLSGILSIVLIAVFISPVFAREPEKDSSRLSPNIVLILADDLGYGELSIQGCTDIPTPNIDSIAENGIRFTQGYVTHPSCVPSRAGLLTGQNQHRFGIEDNPARKDFGLEPSVITLAERLRELGYTTGIIGKWHLGSRDEYQPSAHGFDEFFGFLGGSSSYRPIQRNRKSLHILRNDKPVHVPTYLTDAFGQEAVDFIKRHEKQPFFLYLAFSAVHTPLEAKMEDLQKFDAIQDPTRRTYAAMTEAMDRAVGKVLDTLRTLNLEEDTLVFFISDNGGQTQKSTSSNMPLRGFKAQLYEGGIRVPFLVQWKNHLPRSETYKFPVSTLDVYPTAVAAAGGKLDPQWKLDGVNLLPYLRAENKTRPHKTLFWRVGEGARYAVLHGDWKLILAKGNSIPQLFNIANDIGETEDLASENPEIVKQLQTLFDQWSSQMEPNRWKKRPPRKPDRFLKHWKTLKEK